MSYRRPLLGAGASYPGHRATRLGQDAARTRHRRTALLEEAIAAYRAALEERTRERVPVDWAATQNNLGTTLSMLGKLHAEGGD